MQIENHKEEVPFAHYEEAFQNLNAQEAAARTGAKWDGKEFYVNLLGREFAISHPDYAIRPLDGGALPPLPVQTFLLRWLLEGKKVSVDNTNKFVLDYKKAENARFTFHLKDRIEDGMKYRYYAIYLGDNETRNVKISNFLPKKAKLVVENDGYNAKDKGLWTVENYEDGSCRLVPMMSHSEMPICLAVLEDGTIYDFTKSPKELIELF